VALGDGANVFGLPDFVGFAVGLVLVTGDGLDAADGPTSGEAVDSGATVGIGFWVTSTSGGIGFLYSGSAPATGTINTSPNFSLFRAISGSGAFKLNSEETITSDYIFVRPRSSEFNYSENPSFISGSTGEVLYPEFINSPQVYITTVGLYNDNNELLAVAKLSRPLVKDFTKEALVRVKLDF
jgi:hypothetical protein